MEPDGAVYVRDGQVPREVWRLARTGTDADRLRPLLGRDWGGGGHGPVATQDPPSEVSRRYPFFSADNGRRDGVHPVAGDGR